MKQPQYKIGGLQIGQNAPQHRVSIGHGIVKLQQAEGSIPQDRIGVILRIAQVPLSGAVPFFQCPFQMPGIHIGGQNGIAFPAFKQNVTAERVELVRVKGLCRHLWQKALGRLIGHARGPVGRQGDSRMDEQKEDHEPKHRRQHTAERRLHQIAQEHGPQGSQFSFFHWYPTPHTVFSSASGSATPAARNLARIFLMCWVIAVSSAVPSMPNTVS